MGTVNVNRNVTDVFYRYKMPRINAKVEGKGNGIKTVIVNMIEVAKAIGRPATYPTKYFGCELGAQTQFDYKVKIDKFSTKKTKFFINFCDRMNDLSSTGLMTLENCKIFSMDSSENSSYALSVIIPRRNFWCRRRRERSHRVARRVVSGFFFFFKFYHFRVLNVFLFSNKGFHGPLEVNHKVNTFIIKNPPNVNPANQGASLTESKRSKRSKKAGENGETNENADASVGDDVDGSKQETNEKNVSFSNFKQKFRYDFQK